MADREHGSSQRQIGEAGDPRRIAQDPVQVPHEVEDGNAQPQHGRAAFRIHIPLPAGVSGLREASGMLAALLRYSL